MTNPTGTDMEMARELLNALKLARLHIADTPTEHAIISLDHLGVGLGGYLDAVISQHEAAATRLEGLTISDEMVERAVAAMCAAKITDHEGTFPPLRDLIDFSGENKFWTVVRALAHVSLTAALSPTVYASPELKTGAKP